MILQFIYPNWKIFLKVSKFKNEFMKSVVWGQKSWQFSIIFREKQWLLIFILEFTDLYAHKTLKSGHSEKHTKFEKIFHLYLKLLSNIKFQWKIFSSFVCFSENPNFNRNQLGISLLVLPEDFRVLGDEAIFLAETRAAHFRCQREETIMQSY